MTFDYLKHIKANNQTLKILNSDNFAFTLSFFHLVFIKKRNLTIKHTDMLEYLDDYLFDINNSYENLLPKSSKEYLDDFANDRIGYLRKYHGDEDEALYELTPYINRALEFIESLEKSEFVGSRSKFNTMFELLEDLEFETNMDDVERVKRLEIEKREIDAQIKAIQLKEDIRFDDARIKEHYMHIEEIVRHLKYDFSEMEYNFRDLNRIAMEQIALKDDAKSGVLDSIFDIEDRIRESDQGKSFFAFWQLLTDTKKSERLTKLFDNLYTIDTINQLDKEKKLQDVKYTLLKSGEKIYRVSAKLIEQLRRFIDDRVWIENRRVLQLCQEIEKSSIEIKENLPTAKDFFEMKGDSLKIESVFAKPLYSIKTVQEFKQENITQPIEIDMESFYNLFFVDEERLKRNIAEMFLKKSQFTLLELLTYKPIEKGLSELVGYISIAKNMQNTVVDEQNIEFLNIIDFEDNKRTVKLPKIIFSKGEKR